jgi:hypothetical protein
MRGGYHDAYNNLASENLSYSTSGGTAVSTTGFSSMTRYVRLSAPGRSRRILVSDTQSAKPRPPHRPALWSRSIGLRLSRCPLARRFRR